MFNGLVKPSQSQLKTMEAEFHQMIQNRMSKADEIKHSLKLSKVSFV